MTEKKQDQPLIIPNTILTLIIPKEQATKAYKKSLAKLSVGVKTAGFRKGKVPTQVAEELLGSEKIIEEALQQVVPDLYQRLIESEKKHPLTYPEFKPVSLNKEEDWKLEVHIAEKPEIKLGNYTKTVKDAKKKAAAELEKQQVEMKKHVEEAIKNGEKHDHPHEITEPQKREHVLQTIYQELITTVKPQIAELLVKEETRYDLDNIARRLQQLNITFEKFLEGRKMTFDQLSTELAAGALARLQATFIISAVAEEQKLTVTNKEIEAVIEKTTDEKLKSQQMADPRYQSMLTETLLRQKVADYLLSL